MQNERVFISTTNSLHWRETQYNLYAKNSVKSVKLTKRIAVNCERINCLQ